MESYKIMDIIFVAGYATPQSALPTALLKERLYGAADDRPYGVGAVWRCVGAIIGRPLKIYIFYERNRNENKNDIYMQ